MKKVCKKLSQKSHLNPFMVTGLCHVATADGHRCILEPKLSASNSDVTPQYEAQRKYYKELLNLDKKDL